jgi:hypothetical protein
MLQFFTINTVSEAICLLIALLSFKKSDIISIVSIFFLFITCATEMTAIPIKKHYIADPAHVISNAWLYNILLVFQMTFFSFLFYHLLNKFRDNRAIIYIGFAVLVVLYIVDVTNHGFFEYNNLTNTVMSVLMVCYGFYYYYNLLNNNSYINLRYSSEFWLATGVVLFYFGDTGCNLFYEKIKPILPPNKHYLGYIYNVLNVILYGCWSYAFICRKWITRTSESLS